MYCYWEARTSRNHLKHQLYYLWLLPAWGEDTEDRQSPWWLLDSLVNLFVCLPGCPVLELRSEGGEASCAKHVPRVLRKGRGCIPLRCMSGITIVTVSLKVLCTLGPYIIRGNFLLTLNSFVLTVQPRVSLAALKVGALTISLAWSSSVPGEPQQ